MQRNSPPTKPLCVGIIEFARLMSISDDHAYGLVKSGRVPVVDLCGRKVVPLRWIEETVANAMAAVK